MSIGAYSYGSDADFPQTNIENVKFHDLAFFVHMQNEYHPNYQNIHNFLLHLAVCHTVIT